MTVPLPPYLNTKINPKKDAWSGICCHLAPRPAPNIGFKPIKTKNNIPLLVPLGNDFWMNFDGFGVPSCSYFDTEVQCQINANFERRFFMKTMTQLNKKTLLRSNGSNINDKFDPRLNKNEAPAEYLWISVFDQHQCSFGPSLGSQSWSKNTNLKSKTSPRKIHS